jgi:sarcosine oxidase, subunit delta
MMLLSCPCCGARDESEFLCAGTTHIARAAADASDEEWSRYLFFRDNPKGVHLERWRHVYGCGIWFNLARHTVTHEILAVYPINAPPPSWPETGQ